VENTKCEKLSILTSELDRARTSEAKDCSQNANLHRPLMDMNHCKIGNSILLGVCKTTVYPKVYNC
jgi:hypothetical protein